MQQEVVLDIANPYKDYVIHMDASKYAVGAVLEQEDSKGQLRPVAFFSRKLQGKNGFGQIGWSTREKETYALIATLHEFLSWIADRRVYVKALTDHAALVSWFREDLNTITGPIGRRGRWHEFLSQFNTEVLYTQGKHHIVPDVMSCWAYPACEYAPDACMHGSEANLTGLQQDEAEVKKWEDHQIAGKDCGHAQHVRAVGDTGVGLQDKVRVLFACAPENGGPDDRPSQGQPPLQPQLRQNLILQRMQSQCWGLEAAARIACISARTRSRGEQNVGTSVAGARRNLAVQADSADGPPSQQTDDLSQAGKQPEETSVAGAHLNVAVQVAARPQQPGILSQAGKDAQDARMRRMHRVHRIHRIRCRFPALMCFSQIGVKLTKQIQSGKMPFKVFSVGNYRRVWVCVMGRFDKGVKLLFLSHWLTQSLKPCIRTRILVLGSWCIFVSADICSLVTLSLGSESYCRAVLHARPARLAAHPRRILRNSGPFLNLHSPVWQWSL